MSTKKIRRNMKLFILSLVQSTLVLQFSSFISTVFIYTPVDSNIKYFTTLDYDVVGTDFKDHVHIGTPCAFAFSKCGIIIVILSPTNSLFG